MPLTQCALFYWTSTNILTGKLLADDDSQYAVIAPSPGQSLLLVATVKTARGQGCPDDDACRQLIAEATKTRVLTADADLCAQLDNSGNVVTVLKADPANVTPVELGLPADQQFVTAHPLAMAGDTFSGGVFSRRYAIADTNSKQVQSIAVVPVDQSPTKTASQYAVPSLTAVVGDTLPDPRAQTVTVIPGV